jgi:UDP-glucose 4-epimerase
LAGATEAAAGEVFNLGGPPPVTLKALAETLVEINGRGKFQVRAFPADRKKIDIGGFYADWSRIEQALGWRPRTGLRAALRRTLAFYRRERGHYV